MYQQPELFRIPRIQNSLIDQNIQPIRLLLNLLRNLVYQRPIHKIGLNKLDSIRLVLTKLFRKHLDGAVHDLFSGRKHEDFGNVLAEEGVRASETNTFGTASHDLC